MGEVVLFPREERLPKGLEERLVENAKEYVEVLYAALHLLAGENPTKEDLDEITQLVNKSYFNALANAIDQLEL